MNSEELKEKEKKRKKDNEFEKALLQLTISLMSDNEKKYYESVIGKLRELFRTKKSAEELTEGELTSPGFVFLVALACMKNEIENEVMGDMTDLLEKVLTQQEVTRLDKKDLN